MCVCVCVCVCACIHGVCMYMFSNTKVLLHHFREGVLNIEMTFSSSEKRASWETTFDDIKQKLCKSKESMYCCPHGAFLFPFISPHTYIS